MFAFWLCRADDALAQRFAALLGRWHLHHWLLRHSRVLPEQPADLLVITTDSILGRLDRPQVALRYRQSLRLLAFTVQQLVRLFLNGTWLDR